MFQIACESHLARSDVDMFRFVSNSEFCRHLFWHLIFEYFNPSLHRKIKSSVKVALYRNTRRQLLILEEVDIDNCHLSKFYNHNLILTKSIFCSCVSRFYNNFTVNTLHLLLITLCSHLFHHFIYIVTNILYFN